MSTREALRVADCSSLFHSCSVWRCCVVQANRSDCPNQALTAGAIVGIVLGIFFCIAIVVAIVFCFRRRRYQQQMVMTPVVRLHARMKHANEQVSSESLSNPGALLIPFPPLSLALLCCATGVR